MTFAAGNVAAAFADVLGRRPIPFWPFAIWLARAVNIPRDDTDDAIQWLRDTVLEEARLTDAHVGATVDEATAQAKWFYFGDEPDPEEIFSDRPLTAAELREICEAFDVRPAPAQVPGGPAGEAVAVEAPLDQRNLNDVLRDAGNGRRLVIDDQVIAAAITHIELGRMEWLLVIVNPNGFRSNEQICRKRKRSVIGQRYERRRRSDR